MKALDMTKVIKGYPGLFVALSADRKKVFGKGHTPQEAIIEAENNGHSDPIVTKIPTEGKSYLL